MSVKENDMEITIKGKPEELATLLRNLMVGTPKAIKFNKEGVTLTPYVGELQEVPLEYHTVKGE